MRALIFIFQMALIFCNAQTGAVPECIKEYQTKSSLKELQKIELPNNEVVFKFSIVTQQKITDDKKEALFLDDKCRLVAYFNSQIKDNPIVAKDYTMSWFLEKSIKKTATIYIGGSAKRDSIYYARFKTPVKFAVVSVDQKENPLSLKPKDIIEISLQDGLIVNPKSKNKRQYKLKPGERASQMRCIKLPCPQNPTPIFVWDYLRINIGDLDSENIQIYIADSRKDPANFKRNYTLERLKN